MLNKIIVCGVISALSLIFILPSANANYYFQRYGYYDGDGYFENDRGMRKRMHRHYSGYRHHRNRHHHEESSRNFDRVPFPSKIASSNIIKVDLGKLAWGAYDDQGNLVKWGRASGGKNYCPDIHRGCKTITGTFTFYRKQGPGCKSSRFPVPRGGAPMPYCMHFHGSYALHGGNVPNHNASHGCVRVPYQDAQWLNQNFVRVGSTRVSITY